MGVKRHSKGESGQSIIEFLLVLPLMIAITYLLIQVSTLMEVSIVAQQHAGPQALHLAMNSAFYPRLSIQSSLTAIPSFAQNQLVAGVSENTTSGPDEDTVAAGGSSITPQASSVDIGWKKNLVTPPPVGNTQLPASDGGLDAEGVPAELVHVINTVSLCTPSFAIAKQAGGSMVPADPNVMNDTLVAQNSGTKFFSFCQYGATKSPELAP